MTEMLPPTASRVCIESMGKVKFKGKEMMTQPRTSWASKQNPYTGEVPMIEVPIPAIEKPRKGRTKYDAQFEKLLAFKSGIESTEEGFEVLRRAMQRFVKFRNLQDKISIRRQINRKTRMVTLWLEPRDKQ